MTINRISRALAKAAVGLSLAALVFFPLPLRAAPPAPGGVAFGSVDVQKVLDGYSGTAGYDQKRQAISLHYANIFKVQQGYVMLSSAEQTELGTLLAKATPTDPDRARITALEAQSTKDAQELTALQQKQNPTDPDKARMDALLKEQDAGNAALQQVVETYKDQAQAETAKLNAQLSDTVKAAITAVAKERGLAVVFDSQVAIYTANDITTDVVKRLNK